MTDKTDSKEREALVAYLKDCDAHDIVPDVGGAWHAAFQAGRASLAASAGSEPVAWLDAFGQPHLKRTDAMADEHSMPRPLHTADQLKQAIRDALEEAAKVCESRQTPGTGSVAILNGAADAIRKLKEDIQ